MNRAIVGAKNALTKEWDVIAGVALGGITAPWVTQVGERHLGPVVGKWAIIASDLIAAFIALAAVGRKMPGLAVGFASIYLIEAARLGLSALATK